jgi:1-aminocyclopropane-1-carboxylate deaminase/D-cysteine desulfhydrase-like pyridoxal-dependent ACC family enzyme
MTDSIGILYPRLAERLPRTRIADLPTPLQEYSVSDIATSVSVLLKRDDLSSECYGGNKIRKLEYLLHRAKERGAKRVATFGTVASNHALATAIYAKQLDLECTCFLSHQSKTPKAPLALNMHLKNRTEIVRFGGARRGRIDTMRKYVQNRHTWVIPLGGSSWLGVVGFVNAGLELAAQLRSTDTPAPDRLYVATGTMGTAAGLALGLALVGLPTEVQAVRVTHEMIANRDAMRRLIYKTATMMRRLDETIPDDIEKQVRLSFRDEFFAGGYAKSNGATDSAIEFARHDLGVTLDSTYSGKAMAALLHDAAQPELSGKTMLFWNTYNSRALPVTAQAPDDASLLPEEFLRYYV